MRSTRSRTKNRRSHDALSEPTLSKCSHCGALGKPHVMCGECGFYNGRQVVDKEAERVKRDARIKAKKERIRVESAPEPEGSEEGTPVSTEDEHKAANEENTQDKKPEKKPE